jgi:hypothetical protein
MSASSTQPGSGEPTGDPWAWLTEHHEGRLDYESGRGFRSVVVLYAIADGQILFRLPDYNDIVHYAPGERITLEVDGAVTPSGDSTTVIVTGTARLVEIEQMGIAVDAVFDEPWPPEVRTSIIGLPPKDVLLVKNSLA